MLIQTDSPVKSYKSSLTQYCPVVDGRDKLSQKWSFKSEPLRWSSWEKRLWDREVVSMRNGKKQNLTPSFSGKRGGQSLTID